MHQKIHVENQKNADHYLKTEPFLKIKGKKISYSISKQKKSSNGSRKSQSNQLRDCSVLCANRKKRILVHFALIVIDVILVWYMARRNMVHLVQLNGKDVLLGNTRFLLFGRNYVNLIIIAFFSIYTIFLQRFFFKRKLIWKFILGVILFYFVLNIVLFSIFTVRIY